MTTEERVEKLETGLNRERRINRWLLIGLCLIAGGWFSFSFIQTQSAEATDPGAKIIRAKAFIVEDGQGKPRAVMAVPKEGPGIVLYDDQGKTRAVMAVLKEVPGIVLFDDRGKAIWTAQ